MYGMRCAVGAMGLGLAALLAACGGGGGSSADTRTGRLSVALTDAPACGYEAVWVTVDRVRVHASSTAGDADAGWQEIVLPAPRRIDLLTLTNGVLFELGEKELPAGRYTQLRLVLAENGAADPLANAVVPSGGSETALDTPSAQQSGLKLPVLIDVGPNQLADVVLDFDACKSVVKRGNSGRYNLKPVVSVLPRVRTDALVAEGWVDPAIATATTSVSLQSPDRVERTTVPTADGRFVLYPVPEGVYDLVVAADGRATAIVTGVPITATSRTFVNLQTAPIAPPASAMRTVSGSVKFNGSSVVPLAEVQALQATGTGGIQRTSVNSVAETGVWSFAVPASPPVVASYAPAASAVTLLPQGAVAGKYTVRAISGTQSLEALADVSVGDVVLPAFGFAAP